MTTFIEHLKSGGFPTNGACLACDAQPMRGAWTDYNGQLYCMQCGCTYQILGSHLREEWLTENGMTAADVPRQYCDCFDDIGVIRLHWEERQSMARVGMWMGGGPECKGWGEWLESNAERLKELFPESGWDWDRIIERVAAKGGN